MSTSFPAALDSIVKPNATDPQSNPSHSSLHQNEVDALIALETKVGITGSSDVTSLDYKIANISNLQGRSVNSVAPTSGQALAWNAGTSKWEPTTIVAGVTSVFSRTGAVTAQTGDYSVGQITGAVASARLINTTGPLAGGGDLSADRTLTIAKATASVDGYLSAADFTIFNSKVGTHNLLSATHPDTVAASVVLGDLIYGNNTPAWQRLAGNTTGTRKFLRQTGTGSVSAVPAWDTLVSGDIPDLSATYAIVGRLVSAGTGLSGGGSLAADRTISLANTAVTAGSYTFASLTVDAQGRLTSASSGATPATSVSNSDGTLTISPTTGAVVASLALGHANTWSGLQTFGNNISFGGKQLNVTSITTGDFLKYNGTNWINAPVSASPAGNNTDIQFNNSGAFGASDYLQWDGHNLLVKGNNIVGAPSVDINNLTGGTTALSFSNDGTNKSELYDDGSGHLTIATGTLAVSPLSIAGGIIFTNSTVLTQDAVFLWDTAAHQLKLTNLTTGSIPFVASGGAITEDNSQLFWNEALVSSQLGVGTTTFLNNEKVHISGTTLTWPDVTGTPAGIISYGVSSGYPTGSYSHTIRVWSTGNNGGNNLYSTNYATSATVTDDGRTVTAGNVTSPNSTQNTGESGYIASGQTLNYTIYSYWNSPQGLVYQTSISGNTTGTTDSINDGTTPFGVDLTWSNDASHPVSGYVVMMYGGATYFWNDVGNVTSYSDSNSWSNYSGSPFPVTPTSVPDTYEIIWSWNQVASSNSYTIADSDTYTGYTYNANLVGSNSAYLGFTDANTWNPGNPAITPASVQETALIATGNAGINAIPAIGIDFRVNDVLEVGTGAEVPSIAHNAIIVTGDTVNDAYLVVNNNPAGKGHLRFQDNFGNFLDFNGNGTYLTLSCNVGGGPIMYIDGTNLRTSFGVNNGNAAATVNMQALASNLPALELFPFSSSSQTGALLSIRDSGNGERATMSFSSTGGIAQISDHNGAYDGTWDHYGNGAPRFYLSEAQNNTHFVALANTANGGGELSFASAQNLLVGTYNVVSDIGNYTSANHYIALKIFGANSDVLIGYQMAWNVADITAQLGVISGSASKVATKIRGASSQTANLLNIENSGGTVLASVDASGGISGTDYNIVCFEGDVLTYNDDVLTYS